MTSKNGAKAPELPPNIGKLLPRLASEHDAEVVATVRAIGRTLKAAGYDFHDLVLAINKPAEIKTIEVKKEPQTWTELAEFCRDRTSSLNEREADFVTDMVEKTIRFGEPTERQAKWLLAIYGRLRARHAGKEADWHDI